MIKHDQNGTINVLLIPLLVAVLLLIGAIVFGSWAFSGRQDYKNNVDQKISAAVDSATKREDAVKDAQFAEASKLPLKVYSGPETYGSILLSYPRTWSGYVNNIDGSSSPIDAYFQPDVVPPTQSETSTFALRVKVLASSYASTVSSFSGQVQQNTVTVTPYALAKVPSVVGVRVDGQIEPNKNGSMVILPVRDKTLEIYTESNQFLGDFNNSILPNFSFSP